MTGLLLRLLIGALGLWLAAEIIPGIEVANLGTLLAAALLLGVANAA
jgi:putative membrane protein